MASILEQYTIADFLEWHKQKKIILNPIFQRRSVWSATARTFLIDTILRKMPIPKIYLRNIIDLKTMTTVREVVDGQQRLRAIFDFAGEQLTLGKTAKEFQGLTYSTLDQDHQEIFLSYAISTEQLINASDNDVLEVFSRLNSYTIPLNAAELRHAKYQGDFKWTVHESAARWSILWEKFQVVSVRQRVRMLDDALMAEMYGILLEGVTAGGARNITKLYAKLDDEFPNQEATTARLDRVLRFITKEFDQALVEPVSRAPHFLMFFAAVSHALVGIPRGQIGPSFPTRDTAARIDLPLAKENLAKLAAIVADDEAPLGKYAEFWAASRGTTQGIASRKARFPIYYKALFERL